MRLYRGFGMGHAQQVLKNEVVHAIRRTARREFRFPPNSEIRKVFGYLLAYCLNEYDMELYAFCVMPNHYHGELGDLEGRRKEFLQTFHKLLSSVLNVLQGRVHQALFDNPGPSEVLALDPDAVLRNITYILLNPVRAGIERHSEDYSGLLIGPDDWGKELTFQRPDYYFRDFNKFKASLSFTPKAPPGYSPRQARELVDKMVKDGHAPIRREFDAVGRRFAGSKRVARRSINSAPKTPPGAFKTRPRYSFTHKATFIAALAATSNFRSDYKDAMDAFKLGERDVVFPMGTDLYRRRKMVDVEHDDGSSGWFRHYLPPPGRII